MISPTPWQRLPADLATAMRPHLPATVRAIADEVTQATPVFATAVFATAGDAKLTRDIHTAVQVALDRFLDLVGSAEPALPPSVREVFVALGAAEAREDRGPEALLAALRTASRLMLRTACGAMAQVRPMDTDAIVDLSDAVSAFVDELATASTDGFALQVREQAGEGDRRRHQFAELLLRGSAPPSVALDAATRIGWRTLDAMVAVLLPLEQARDARFRYGADGVVVERERDAVLLVREGPRTGRAQLTEALHGRGAVVGPTLAWPQVPEAVRLAGLTAELVGPTTGRAGLTAGQVGADPGPVFVDDHLAVLALRGEPGALAVLAARRLAPLARLTDRQRDGLLVTLRSWLRHWGSRTEVAAELFVHPQTVSYRLKRLRDLLGADLDDPAARFELLLVLSADRH